MRLHDRRLPRCPTAFLLAFTVLAAVRAPCARAQPGPPFPPGGVVEHLSPRVTGNPFMHLWRPEDFDGGPGNKGIVQHPATGFMYFGNSQGVLVYDGARWRLVPVPKSGAVLALTIDVRGRVWVATENEIARLERDPLGSMRAVTVVHPLPEGELGAMDGAVAAPDGIWFRGLQHILRIAPDDTVATWQTAERFGTIWTMDNAVHTTLSDREVVRLDPGGQLAPIFSRDSLRVPASRASPLRVLAARTVAPGETILLTALGPVRWVAATKLWRPISQRPPLFRESEAQVAAFMPDGAMVFGLTRSGGIVMTPEGRVERLLERMPGVVNPRVTHLAADREGGLWAATHDHIARVQLRSGAARHEGPQGLQGNPRQMLRFGEILFLAHTSGISRHVPWPGAFPPAENLQRGADSLVVNGGRLYAAAAGLVELHEHGGPTRSWSDLAITTVAAVRTAPEVMLGGDTQGLWLFRAEGEDWKPAGRLSQLTASVSAIFDRGDGWVWGATSDGRLWRADFRAGARLDAPVKFYGPAQGVRAPAQTRRISFFPLGDSTVATCAAWMMRHDAATDRFVPETRIAGLNATSEIGAEAVGLNADGSCWLRLGAPDRRIVRVVSEGPQRWRTNELPAPFIRELPAVTLYEDRRTLWVAGADLLVSLDLDYQSPHRAPPLEVRLRSVTAGRDESLWTDGVRDPAAPLALRVGQDSLRFEFAAPLFATDHRGRSYVQYRTKLDGLERGWSGWSSEPWRDFTRLPAGRYTFRVQATDQAGRVTPEASLAMMVIAPWWRTPWAWAGYAALAALLVWGVVALRTQTLRHRAVVLEATVAARTEELRRTNAELARLHRLELSEKSAARLAEEEARLEVLRYQLNPHFLYNALNSIYSLALTTPPAAANMVLRLADFCRVALDRRGEDHTTVGAEFDKLSNYLEIEKVRWGDSLHIAVEADEEARRATIPPFLLLPLVENAIKYGGATSPEELRVRVTAHIAPNGDLLLSVANSGEWVDGETPTGMKSSGIGLANLRQRLERHHPGAHVLNIEPKDGWVVVRLRISARLAPNGASHA
jgi:hypothetical protein